MALKCELKKIEDSIKMHCKDMETKIKLRNFGGLNKDFPVNFKNVFINIRKVLQPTQPPLPFEEVHSGDRFYVFHLLILWLKTSDNKYYCPNCNWTFESKSQFQNHLRRVHLNPKWKEVKPDKTKCPFCDKECADLEKHIAIQHTKEKCYKCQFCSKEFYDELTCKYHENSVHTRSTTYPCMICGKRNMYSPISRYKHIRYVHKNKAGSFKCHHCPKKYKNKATLNMHVHVEHKDSNKKGDKFACEFCDQVYDHPFKLKRHNYRKHVQPIREYSCKFCTKKFGKVDLLEQHFRIHTGEAPFSCTICNKTFKTGTNLSQHLRTHSSVKPFVCELCKVSFKFGHHLRNHEKTVSHLANLKERRLNIN